MQGAAGSGGQCTLDGRVPPPSYAEAMAQAAAVKDNADTEYPQVSPYPVPGYPAEGNFYPAGVPPPYNPSNSHNPQIQPGPGSPICIVHREHVLHRRKRTDRTSSKIICAGMLGFVVMIIVVRLILVRTSV